MFPTLQHISVIDLSNRPHQSLLFFFIQSKNNSILPAKTLVPGRNQSPREKICHFFKDIILLPISFSSRPLLINLQCLSRGNNLVCSYARQRQIQLFFKEILGYRLRPGFLNTLSKFYPKKSLLSFHLSRFIFLLFLISQIILPLCTNYIGSRKCLYLLKKIILLLLLYETLSLPLVSPFISSLNLHAKATLIIKIHLSPPNSNTATLALLTYLESHPCFFLLNLYASITPLISIIFSDPQKRILKYSPPSLSLLYESLKYIKYLLRRMKLESLIILSLSLFVRKLPLISQTSFLAYLLQL